jgi:hypothetical protein
MFAEIGLPEPKPIALIPIPHQIAQKLHGISGRGSERAHDLIDLQLIVKNDEVDYPKTKNACIRLFNSRKLQEWPPVISKGDGWDELYRDQLGGLDILQSVDEAVTWANELVARIDRS